MHQNKKKKENEIKEEKKDGVLFRMLVARTYIFFFPPFFPLEMRLFFPTAMVSSCFETSVASTLERSLRLFPLSSFFLFPLSLLLVFPLFSFSFFFSFLVAAQMAAASIYLFESNIRK